MKAVADSKKSKVADKKAAPPPIQLADNESLGPPEPLGPWPPSGRRAPAVDESVDLLPPPNRIAKLPEGPPVAPPPVADRPPRRTDVRGLLKTVELKPSPPKRLAWEELFKEAVLAPAPFRTPVEKLTRTARLKPAPPPEIAEIPKATPVATPPARRTEIERLLRVARLEPLRRKLDVEGMLKVAERAPTAKRLDIEAMLRLVEVRPVPHRLDVAGLFKGAELVPIARRTDVDSMVRLAELSSPYVRRDLDRLLRLAKLSPSRRLDHEHQTKLVKLIPVPDRYLEPVAAAAVPASIQLRPLPGVQAPGRPLLVIARVLGTDRRPMPDQAVEWTIDRQGAGQIMAVPLDPRLGKPSEKSGPTFARTYTAATSYQLDPGYGGVEIGVGETYVALDAASAGTMALAAQAPAIASPAAALVRALVHWDAADAVFPAPVRAQSGAEATLAAKVLSKDKKQSEPLPSYRVRYSLPEGAAAAFANGQSSIEVESGADGRAPVALRQRKPGAESVRGKVELLGRSPLPGQPAPILASGEFAVEWVAPGARLAAEAPKSAAVKEWIRATIGGAVAEAEFARGLRLVALLPSDLHAAETESGGAVDL
ncbi:MAG TPA: hypothetical protein VNC50_04810, partial [Planctomycetia bacterium]|nr:hypothetical protein [Planctomycetia bacterium]